MNRRTVLIGTMAALAGAGGVGFAVWRSAPAPRAPVATPVSTAAPAAPAPTARPDAPAGGLWDLRFEQPDGGTLVMADRRGRWTLLNFWATWCPPCVKEIPMLDGFHREHGARGWQVVGLAIDGVTPVRQFLQRQPVAFPVGMAGLDGLELVRALGNTSGALPFTVILDPTGAVVDRKLGELREADLVAWARRHTP
ncbi:MAG: TlpA family protein disulfide reductase [Ideonella sp.]|nr:TlpA family protein disulfide reductase [Ideonella sp.]